jgi:hypothetical protein
MYMKAISPYDRMGFAADPFNPGIAAAADWQKFIDTEGWFTLQPGERTGQLASGAQRAVPTVGFLWLWLFQNSTDTYNGYAWADGVIADRWAGYTDTTVLPYYGTERADNIDRFDTMLGKEAAKRLQTAGQSPLSMRLVFQLTVEQVN